MRIFEKIFFKAFISFLVSKFVFCFILTNTYTSAVGSVEYAYKNPKSNHYVACVVIDNHNICSSCVRVETVHC